MSNDKTSSQDAAIAANYAAWGLLAKSLVLHKVVNPEVLKTELTSLRDNAITDEHKSLAVALDKYVATADKLLSLKAFS